MSNTDIISVLVLAGGKSSRMGRDKAEVLLHGRPMIEWGITSVRIALLLSFVMVHTVEGWKRCLVKVEF